MQLYSCANSSKMVAAPLAVSRMLAKGLSGNSANMQDRRRRNRESVSKYRAYVQIGAVRSFRPVSRYKTFDEVRAQGSKKQ